MENWFSEQSSPFNYQVTASTKLRMNNATVTATIFVEGQKGIGETEHVPQGQRGERKGSMQEGGGALCFRTR